MKSIFKFQMISRRFYGKLVAFHLKNQAKEVHQLKLEEKRKKKEEEKRLLEEENKLRQEENKRRQEENKRSEEENIRKIEENKKFQKEIAEQIDIGSSDSQQKLKKGKKHDFQMDISNKESYGGNI